MNAKFSEKPIWSKILKKIFTYAMLNFLRADSERILKRAYWVGALNKQAFREYRTGGKIYA